MQQGFLNGYGFSGVTMTDSYTVLPALGNYHSSHAHTVLHKEASNLKYHSSRGSESMGPVKCDLAKFVKFQRLTEGTVSMPIRGHCRFYSKVMPD